MFHREPLVVNVSCLREPVELVLGKDTLAKLRDALGVRICCISGALWVTQENDSRDICVDAGAWFELDRSGLALISSASAEIGAVAVVVGRSGDERSMHTEITSYPEHYASRRARATASSS